QTITAAMGALPEPRLQGTRALRGSVLAATALALPGARLRLRKGGAAAAPQRSTELAASAALVVPMALRQQRMALAAVVVARKPRGRQRAAMERPVTYSSNTSPRDGFSRVGLYGKRRVHIHCSRQRYKSVRHLARRGRWWGWW